MRISVSPKRASGFANHDMGVRHQPRSACQSRAVDGGDNRRADPVNGGEEPFVDAAS